MLAFAIGLQFGCGLGEGLVPGDGLGLGLMPGDGLGLMPGDGLGLMPGDGLGLMPGDGLGLTPGDGLGPCASAFAPATRKSTLVMAITYWSQSDRLTSGVSEERSVFVVRG